VQNPLNKDLIEQIDSSTIIKTSLTNGWNASLYSLEAFIHFNLSFTIGSLHPNAFIGLSYFPSLNTSTSNVDFGFHIGDDRSICIYENDTLVKICIGEFTTTTVFSIQYTGFELRYYIDGFIIYAINKEIIHPLHANFLIYSSGYYIQNILFYPLILGPTGAQGLIGATGAQGLQGATGAQGLEGATGAQGLEGPTGAQGLVGATGTQGLEGATGAHGLQGATGAEGLQGATGAQGFEGSTGAQGLEGPTGAQGLEGPTGAQGLEGPTGAQGLVGATGAQGLVGATGAQGLVGATGAEGATGAQGATGALGLDGLTGAEGLRGPQGLDGSTGAQGPTGAEGPTGTQGRDGLGIPSGGFPGQILLKNSEEDYDTKWSFTNQLRIDSLITLEATVEFLNTTVKHLECRYNLLSKNKFSKFNSEFLTYSTLLRSYMNLIAVFDGGNSTSEYSRGPVFDCGEGVEQFTDMVVIRINAGHAISSNFSTREGSIQYLESLYPDEEEQDLILDGGQSSTNYSICPLIDCGNVGDFDIVLDAGPSFQFNSSTQGSHIILDGGISTQFAVNSEKLDLGNSIVI
jgi:hypothetical protein